MFVCLFVCYRRLFVGVLSFPLRFLSYDIFSWHPLCCLSSCGLVAFGLCCACARVCVLALVVRCVRLCGRLLWPHNFVRVSAMRACAHISLFRLCRWRRRLRLWWRRWRRRRRCGSLLFCLTMGHCRCILRRYLSLSRVRFDGVTRRCGLVTLLSCGRCCWLWRRRLCLLLSFSALAWLVAPFVAYVSLSRRCLFVCLFVGVDLLVARVHLCCLL